jgi:hypothetical protein
MFMGMQYVSEEQLAAEPSQGWPVRILRRDGTGLHADEAAGPVVGHKQSRTLLPLMQIKACGASVPKLDAYEMHL